MQQPIVRSGRWAHLVTTHLVTTAAVAASFAVAANAVAQSTTTNTAKSTTTAATTPAAAPAASTPDYLDLGIGIHIGTAGYGVSVNKLLFSHLGVRAELNYFSLTKNGSTNSGVTYDGKIKLQTIPILADLYPWQRGSFHLTGGYVINDNKITVTGVPSGSGNYTFNGQSYTSSQVGTLTGGVKWPTSGGYAGLGWGTPARHSPLTVTFDLGAIISTPTFSLTASNASSVSGLQANLDAQAAKTQKDVNKIKAYPVIALGLMYRL